MRQRAKRDLTAILGVIVVLAIVIFVNYTYNVGANAKKMDKVRSTLESARQNDNMDILKWHHMRATKGSLRSGPEFSDELLALNNSQVNVIGFMVPENEFRDVSTFMLLPLPIECYFCNRPPVKDIMVIHMEEGTKTRLYETPVLINGVLRLNEGPNQKSFYTIDHAALEAAEKGARLKVRYIPEEHMLPQHTKEVVLQEGVKLESDS